MLACPRCQGGMLWYMPPQKGGSGLHWCYSCVSRALAIQLADVFNTDLKNKDGGAYWPDADRGCHAPAVPSWPRP